MRSLILVLLATSSLLAGCLNTDTAIFVAPSLEEPTVAVSTSALATQVSGAFHLTLHLGARASGPSAVTLLTMGLVDAATENSIVTSLVVDPGAFLPPYQVPPDSDVEVAFTFTKQLSAGSAGTETVSMLCVPGGVRLRGQLQDSLQDTTTWVDSDVVHATGCP